VAVSAVVMSPPAPATAHPLGNFTINTSTAIVVRGDELVVDRVLDMAEIPAFRERRAIDGDLDGRVSEAESSAYRGSMCERLAAELVVRVGGRRIPLVDTGTSVLSFPAGAGGLSTLRLVCRSRSAVEPSTDDASISVVDRSYPDAIGWREITAVGDRVTIVAADVPSISATDRLSDYPAEALPVDVRRAELRVRAGGPPLASGLPTLEAGGSAAPPGAADAGALASLLGADDLTPLLVLTMIGVALGMGALHALGPGHGKTLIGAYLVGAGGSLRHAVGVGTAVSVMHTASVLALGLLVLSAERLFAPERVYPVLGVLSGLIALGLGSSLLVARIHARTVDPDDTGHGHHQGHRHRHGHPHPHPHDVEAVPAAPLTRRGLTALAVSGGVLPSPSALVALLAAVSLGRTALGLVLIATFSIGLAASLTGVGIVTLRARDFAQRRFAHRTARLLPLASAAAIVATGVFLTVQGVLRL
jgi:ABC-type nickel/cobalt efflux system permease component RcnA